MMSRKFYDYKMNSVVNWLVGETCYYVEDVDGLQSPLELKKPAEWPEQGSRRDQQRAILSVAKSEFVYIITSTENKGVSKIGRSRDPKKRLKNLQTGSPYKLHIQYTYGLLTRKSCLALERRVHKLLKADHLSGEWFNVEAKDAELVINEIIDNAIITHEDDDA